MRHGQSEEGQPDHDRALTDQGMRDVRRQGQNIFKTRMPEWFIVSTAVRTVQTVEHLQEELKFDEKIVQLESSIYNATIRELFEMVTHLDNLWLSVCLIGHNSSITYLAEYLTGASVDYMNPADIVEMRIDENWANISQGGAYFESYLPAG